MNSKRRLDPIRFQREYEADPFRSPLAASQNTPY